MRVSHVSQGVFLAAALALSAIATAQVPDANLLLQALTPRSLGPVNMGGRVSEIAVYDKDPRIFYVAAASGGLWKTTGGGVKFEPVFQYESASALGAVTVDQDNPDRVWVGTGEQNSRNSSSWGAGVFKSEDGGKSWSFVGLEKTHHISKIAFHPKDKNVVYVAAMGDLWGPSSERGVFKTTDGGKTWNKIHYINDMTGTIDMIMDPRNPDTLIIAQWQKKRTAYSFASGGPGSGVYKTIDGGKTWKKLTKGLPSSEMGRVGLTQFRKNPNVLIASVESKEDRGIYKSTDLGESWTFLNNLNPRPFYFSVPRIDPSDESRVYVPGTNFHYSEDGGKSFKVMNINIHVDYHAMWINPNDNNHMMTGNDGGIAVTRDRGVTWEHLDNLVIGQPYAVAVDMRRPYWVYGGFQDNGTWGIPSQSERGNVTMADARFFNGGDGFYVQVDPTDWRTVYAESQGGAIARHNMQTGEQRFIRPRAPQGETYRFNWNTPFIISPHNPQTLWLGGNKLFKSVNRGDTWTEASPDLTTNDPEKLKPGGGVSPESTGAEMHCTIITISESPRKADVVWVGTDDGNIQLTQDGGKNWEKITIPDVPAGTWVSRVVASNHSLNRAYVAFDGHRSANFNSYLYMTDDMGKTWKKLSGSLGENEVVYSVCEGRVNPDLLFAGTEMGLWVSLDRGSNWTKVNKQVGFPTVRVDDMLIHPTEADLVIATHGRSFWTIPVSALEQITRANMEKEVFLCQPTDAYTFGKIFDGWFEGDRILATPNTQPGTTIYYYLKESTEEKVEVNIKTADGQSLGKLAGKGAKGLNSVFWRPRGNRGATLATGTYLVELTVGEKTFATTVRYEDLVAKPE
ncbi:MAG: hypothetical protein KF824_02625 [Fimbriimonadaceae bacterium]|nr:MAG: hypothetical protein KF824_02625 [Fimbriimonadaceae bacterium]